MSIKADRERFNQQPAEQLARKLGLTARWGTGEVSLHFAYFADADRLAVIGGPQETPRDLDRALAYGLSYVGDRKLMLVLPAGRVTPTLKRAAFLDVPIEVFEHEHGELTSVAPMSRREVLQTASAPLVTEEHDLRKQAAWVRALVDWADKHPELTPAHRSSYRAWHCEGRMVLQLVRVGNGIVITAGIDRMEHVARSIVGDDDLRALCVAVDAAVDDRLRGPDNDPDEHRLQAVLGANPEALGFDVIQREVAAFRPSHGRNARGFIDLVGVSRRDGVPRLHLVETKLGPDEMLVLQALDYWIWAEANRDPLTTLFDVPAETPIQIDYVLSRKNNGRLIGSHTASQAEALAEDIAWCFHEAVQWSGGPLEVRSWPTRQVPDISDSRHTPPRRR